MLAIIDKFCLIINAPSMKNRQEINRLAEKAMSRQQYQELLSVRIESLDSWERMKQNHYPFVENILREGAPIWKNH